VVLPLKAQQGQLPPCSCVDPRWVRLAPQAGEGWTLPGRSRAEYKRCIPLDAFGGGLCPVEGLLLTSPLPRKCSWAWSALAQSPWGPDCPSLLSTAGEVLGSIPTRSQGHFLTGPSKRAYLNFAFFFFLYTIPLPLLHMNKPSFNTLELVEV